MSIAAGLYFENKDNVIVLDLGSQPLTSLLGIDVNEKSLVAKKVDSKYEDSLELISQLSGVLIKCKAPTRIGASMGRPEKANERRLKPPPHVLFPLGDSGGNQRLVNTALKERPSRRGFNQGLSLIHI